jgi:hypothetical protein
MNVKPGEFAKVIQPHFRAGVLVTVAEACSPADFAMLCSTDAEWAGVGQVWLCRLLTGSKAIHSETGTAGYLVPGDESWIADVYLRRIDPEADDTTEDTAERLPAPREAVTS